MVRKQRAVAIACRGFHLLTQRQTALREANCKVSQTALEGGHASSPYFSRYGRRMPAAIAAEVHFRRLPITANCRLAAQQYAEVKGDASNRDARAAIDCASLYTEGSSLDS